MEKSVTATGPSGSPSGIVANDVPSNPEPVAAWRWWTTVGERRAFGWLAIAVSLVFCVPSVLISISIFRDWDRVVLSNSPLWVLPLMLGCYVALPVASLCVGRGLLSDRVKLGVGGGLLFVGALLTLLVLFVTYD